MKKINLKNEELLAIILITFAVASRLLPHPANFAPIAAVAIFGAFVFKNVYLKIAVPLLAMLISDAIIGFYTPLVLIAVYFSFSLSALLGLLLRKNPKIQNGIGVSLLASVQFFIITNLAVFLFTPLYSKNWQGLISCFYLALPFFRNTILGDLFYVGSIFGFYFGLKYLFEYSKKAKLSFN